MIEGEKKKNYEANSKKKIEGWSRKKLNVKKMT
jgi:hypothetical protein